MTRCACHRCVCCCVNGVAAGGSGRGDQRLRSFASGHTVDMCLGVELWRPGCSCVACSQHAVPLAMSPPMPSALC